MTAHAFSTRLTTLPFEDLMRVGGYETANEIGRVLGVSRGVVQQLKVRGVPIHRADEYAIACGFHPVEVWGDAYYAPLKYRHELTNA